MKKLSLAAICAVVLIFVVGLSAPVKADPYIVVVPYTLLFGEVVVDTSSVLTVTIMNSNGHDLIVSSIRFADGSSEAFSLTTPPTLPIPITPGSIFCLEVTFSPFAEGEHMGTLIIYSNASNDPDVEVPLHGVGIAVTPIDETLNFFNESAAAGSLTGSGPGESAERRLNALRNMLEAARDLIEAGDIEDACGQLEDAYNRCDGQLIPPDFVEGDDTPELNTMILELMANLGCE